MNIEKQSMENRCAMIPLGSNKPCKNKPVKNSAYCKVHKYILKLNKSKVVQQNIKSVISVMERMLERNIDGLMKLNLLKRKLGD